MTTSIGKQCSACKALQRPTAKFCSRCGISMTPLVACEVCGESTPADGAFCDQCGVPRDEAAPSQRSSRLADAAATEWSSALPATTDVREAASSEIQKSKGDLRVVTVLFADVSGFTAMSETLDPEDVADIMNLVFERLTEAIVAEGGTIDKYIGDCVMAVFGAPRSFGDDPERAVRAASRMHQVLQDLVSEIEIASGTALKMRIGLNTGQVRAGYVGGKGHGGYTVMGDTVNLANRLEAACEVGRVMVSAATARLVADSFVLSEPQALTVKGKQEQVLAAYVLRERALTLQDGQEFFEGIPVPLIGRSAELEVLERITNEVTSKAETHSLVVRGPRGIGKSHLVETYLRMLGEDAGHLAYARESSTGGGAPLGVICRALSRAIEEAYDSVELAMDRIWRLSECPDHVEGSLWVAASNVTREFFAGLRLFDGLVEESVQAREHTLIWGLGHIVGFLARTKPVVIFVAGGQYLDPLSLRALHTFAALLPSGSRGIWVVLEMTLEQGQSDQSLERFLAETNAEELAIEPLEDWHVAALIEALLGRCNSHPAWIVQWLVARSEGSPLFAMEFLRALCDVGVIQINDEEGWLIDEEPPVDGQLPDTIQSAFQARIDHLTDEAKLVVSRLSVLGDIFWDQILYESLDGELDREVAQQTLLRLVSQGVIRRRAQSEMKGCDSYRFESTYWREVAFDALLQRERQHHHAKMASALKLFGVHESDPGLVAWQLHQAGHYPEAAALYVEAGRTYLRLAQTEELKATLDELKGVLEAPSAEHGRRVAHFNDRLWFEALSAHHAYQCGEIDVAKDLIRQSFALIESTPERRHPTVMGNLARVQTELYMLLGHLERTQGAFNESEKAYEEAETLAVSLKDSEPLLDLDLKRWRALSLTHQKRHDEASLISKSVLEARKADVEIAQGHYAEVLAGHFDVFGHCVFATDKDYYKALYYFEQGRSLRKRLDNPLLLNISDANIGMALGELGQWDAARHCFERCVTIRENLNHREKTIVARLNLGYCLMRMQLTDEAVDVLSRARTDAETIGAKGYVETADRFLGSLNGDDDTDGESVHT